jgi:hypothetical protein
MTGTMAIERHIRFQRIKTVSGAGGREGTMAGAGSAGKPSP